MLKLTEILLLILLKAIRITFICWKMLIFNYLLSLEFSSSARLIMTKLLMNFHVLFVAIEYLIARWTNNRSWFLTNFTFKFDIQYRLCFLGMKLFGIIELI